MECEATFTHRQDTRRALQCDPGCALPAGLSCWHPQSQAIVG